LLPMGVIGMTPGWKGVELAAAALLPMGVIGMTPGWKGVELAAAGWPNIVLNADRLSRQAISMPRARATTTCNVVLIMMHCVIAS